MPKRKVSFGRFGIRKKPSFELESMMTPIRLSLPSPSREAGGDDGEDDDVDNIPYHMGAENYLREDVEKLRYPRDEADDCRIGGQDGSDSWARGEKVEIAGGVISTEAQEEVKQEDIDPLDAFMETIHEEVKMVPVKRRLVPEEWADDEDDPMESFLRAQRDTGLSLAAEVLHAGYDSDEEVYAAAKAVDNGIVEYDSDDNPIVKVNRKRMDALPQLHHSDIDYLPFNRKLYEESSVISGMSDEEVTMYRESLSIRVSGFDVPSPVKSFQDLGLNSALMAAILKQGYEKPTPIQCQTLPIALSGRDMIGIAKTGSGKTAAFLLPLIVHIMDQPELEFGEGPIGVICSPTRELAQQIYSQAKRFAKVYDFRVSRVYGGMSKFEQFRELKAGCEIVVATPGRLIDMLKMKAITMFRGTYLVLDEADQMFDLGFEPQIRSIVGQMRPDRQTILFSATMPPRVERLVREILSDSIRVTVGVVGVANEDITQVVTVLPSDVEKLPWLLSKLPGMVDDGETLVFASTRVQVEEVEGQLQRRGFKVAALHGDKDQASRTEILSKFRMGVFHVLVATDVAARGLHIKSIKTVVNYDVAKDMDSHVHRIGRTGRAGDKEGVAHTLITQKEARFGGELVKCLVSAGQNIPMELMDLAMKDGRFRTERESQGRGGGKGKGRGKGRGSGITGGGHGPGSNGGSRSVRGVDFGMGIGYSPDSAHKTSLSPSQISNKPKQGLSRQISNDALKVGMLASFKNSFVAASPEVIAKSSSSPATPSQYSVNGDRVRLAKRRSGSSGAPPVDHKSNHLPGNEVGSGGGDCGYPSRGTMPCFETLQSGGQLGSFIAEGSISGFVPRSTYESCTSSTPLDGKEGGTSRVTAAPMVQVTKNGSKDTVSIEDGAVRDPAHSRWDNDWGWHDKNQGWEKGGSSSSEREHSPTRERPHERRRTSGWDQ